MLEFTIFTSLIAVKLLMINTDPSTDFEVHRNWKAITNSLPVSRWYHDTTSEWTLDYPPFFAYFEMLLGFISKFFDEGITKLDNLYYRSTVCLYYQRLTVLLGDLLLLYAIRKLSKSLELNKTKQMILLALIQGYAGLLIVDNMHFQYNTLLYSVMIISISYVLEQKFIQGAIMFTILLNMKHIFLYIAPAYVIIYLKHYVLNKGVQITRLMKLISTMSLVCLVSFSPFFISEGTEGIKQIIKRMFPFKRGLLHSYWAPNFWAIYSFIDKLLFKFKNKGVGGSMANSSALGLTQETSFDLLPNVTAGLSNGIVISLCLIYITKCLIDRNSKDYKRDFLNHLISSSLIFFNFGFHVHEKAFILPAMIILVKSIYTETDHDDYLAILLGCFAQMPLIHTVKDYIIKLCLIIAYTLLSHVLLKRHKWGKLVILYIFLCIGLDLIITVSPLLKDLQPFTLLQRYEFLPLMLFSVINAIILQVILIKKLIKK